MTGVSRFVPGAVVRVMAAIMALLILLLTSGCSSSPTKENDTMKDAFEALMKRPNLTAVEADYQLMFATIRERLTTEVGVSQWTPDRDPITGSACGGEISNLDGAEMRLYNAGTSHGNLPDSRWDEAVAIVTEVASKHGFGAPQVIVDGPSDHEVELRDTYRGQLLFGTGANTILTGFTGCHLTEDAHQRGTYLPPKEY